MPETEAASLAERLAALGRLGEKTGEDLLGQVVASFLRQSERDLETMRRTLACGDGAAFAAAAHSLAGSSGVLGVARLATGCAELERLARQEDLAACESRLTFVEQTCQEVTRRLQSDPPGSAPTQS